MNFKIYTTEYVINQFGYDFNINVYTTVCCVVSTNDDIPYMIDIDNTGKFHVYGGKYELFHDSDYASLYTVSELLNLTNDEKLILQNIQRSYDNINKIIDICADYGVLFNDNIITVQ